MNIADGNVEDISLKVSDTMDWLYAKELTLNLKGQRKLFYLEQFNASGSSVRP